MAIDLTFKEEEGEEGEGGKTLSTDAGTEEGTLDKVERTLEQVNRTVELINQNPVLSKVLQNKLGLNLGGGGGISRNAPRKKTAPKGKGGEIEGEGESATPEDYSPEDVYQGFLGGLELVKEEIGPEGTIEEAIEVVKDKEEAIKANIGGELGGS